MEIQRPQARPLTPQEQQAMEEFRQRVHALALQGGLSAQNMRNLVRAMKQHPDFSADILQVLFDELQERQQIAPGTSLMDLE